MAKTPKVIKEPFDYWHQPATITVNNFKYKSLSNWAFNISVGCSHACRFCYVPSSATNKQAPELAKYSINDPDEQWGEYSLLRSWDKDKFLKSLKSAKNTPKSKRKKDGNSAIIFCSTTDAYQVFRGGTPEKAKLLNHAAFAMVERALVAIRDKSKLNVRILTRSPLAKKHFDLFKTFGNRLVFGMSLPTLDDRLARVYEPKAPSPSQRLKTLQEAKEAGLHIFVAMAPTYPECNEADIRRTLTAIKELDPITIFHEPINIRAENVARIEKHAASLNPPVKVKTEVFATQDAWRKYALESLLLVQRVATELKLIDHLHLWPDKNLKTRQHFLRIRMEQRTGLTPHQRQLTRQQDLKNYDEKYLPWLETWWNRVSEWPGKK